MATRSRSTNGAKSRSSFYRNREVICSTKLEDCEFFKECSTIHNSSELESSPVENEEEETLSTTTRTATSDSDSDWNMSDQEDDFDYFSNFFGSKT